MKILLAGNWTQAREYMREHGLAMHDIAYASSREAVMGLDGEVVRIGTWHERPDASEIERYLSYRTRVADQARA